MTGSTGFGWFAPVAQLVRATGLEPVSRRFKSGLEYTSGEIGSRSRLTICARATSRAGSSPAWKPMDKSASSGVRIPPKLPVSEHQTSNLEMKRVGAAIRRVASRVVREAASPWRCSESATRHRRNDFAIEWIPMQHVVAVDMLHIARETGLSRASGVLTQRSH